MRDAGMETTWRRVDIPFSIPKSVYLSMVRRKWMSLLASFTDVEIEAGIAELEKRFGPIDLLQLSEEFIFVYGVKSREDS
ncbi:hypothetical protein [Pseudofrankia sp. DC12]|uniref:hypothetical protein n=1 Tax=Pseudofrankia sp. DC12 TaxID=683315 RepID=UPI000A3DA74E|nr:hypothetical protein [Pseudofrankia sp. DC12]